MNPLEQTLLDRACRYGSFGDVTQRTNNIFASMLNGAPQLSVATPLYREALHAIAVKIARLVTGQINDGDSWLDIAGYAMLVHQQIVAEQEAKKAKEAKPFRKNSSDDKAMVDMEAEITAEMKEDW